MKIDSVSHDYAPVNRAIDAELAKHKANNNLLRSHAFLNVCIGLGLLLLLLGLAYYLYRLSIQEPEVQFVYPENVAEDREIAQELAQIDAMTVMEDQGDANISVVASPHREYTVFLTVMSESGEEVVTGRTYSGGELERPARQYCYLDSGAADFIGGTPLAEISEGGAVSVVTEDSLLKGYASRYCRFVN